MDKNKSFIFVFICIAWLLGCHRTGTDPLKAYVGMWKLEGSEDTHIEINYKGKELRFHYESPSLTGEFSSIYTYDDQRLHFKFMPKAYVFTRGHWLIVNLNGSEQKFIREFSVEVTSK